MKTGVAVSVAALCLLFAPGALALDTSHYAPASALASGRWVKVKVGSTGMYLLSDSFLRGQGFSDPAKVNVYGFGGRMAPDVLTTDTGDDLPLLPAVRTDKGILFYATDNIRWAADGSHIQHAYCDESYYFISDREAGAPAMATASPAVAEATDAVEMFVQRLLHEKDLISPANTGRIMLGEDFRTQTSRSFPFELPGIASAPDVKVVFGAKTSGVSSSFTVTANGTLLNGSGTVIPAVSSGEGFLRLGTFYGTAPATGDRLELKIDYSYGGALTTAALDYIEVSYRRKLEIPSSGSLPFSLNLPRAANVSVGNAESSTEIWDVTVPHRPVRMPASVTGGKALFVAPSGFREYVAFTPGRVSASPAAAGTVSNQDIHGLPTPDMVVISPKEYMSAAERVAQMRRDVDGYTVHVLTPEQVYNEFASGSKDVGAFRKMLKMWRDRAAAEGDGRTLYCLIWGKPDYNFKTMKRDYVTVPVWLSPDGLSQSTSYSTDFYIGMTDDCPGAFDISSQKIRVAIGRLPVKSAAEAEAMADKLVRYVTKPDFGSWRNQTVIVADDQDNGVHLDQAERFYSGARGNGMGANYLYERIYLDSYPLEYSSVGPAYPKAKARMLKMIDDGVAHFTYIGHASTRGWGHEQLFKWLDITSLTNKRLPFIYAATCEFGRWDNDDICGSEHMLANTSGGIIGTITPSRTVYITNNGMLTKELGAQLFRRGADGRGLTVGESFTAAMNAMTGADDNKLRYCVISDPALRLPMPERTAAIETINGVDISDRNADAPVVPALGTVNVTGSVRLPDGTVDTSFSGFVTATLYDAEIPVTTYGNGEKGVVTTYNDRKTRLLTDKAPVSDGVFDFTLFMPAEIENNWSPALLNLYACSDDGLEANGASERLYLYGFNDDALADTDGPEIRRFTLNDDNFRSGDRTHRTPLVLATLADPSGINLSDGGIGHRLTLLLDGRTVYDDLVAYFSSDPAERGAGELAFPLPEVEPGKHSLKLIAWDNVNNSSTAELEFTAQMYRKPTIYDVTTDVNPATTTVRFTVTHDMPSVAATCTVSVYDLGGRRVWSGSVRETVNPGAGVDISWNLTDGNGNRVPKGIYIYRASVATPDGVESTASRRLLVN